MTNYHERFNTTNLTFIVNGWSKQAYKHTHMHNAVPLVLGSITKHQCYIELHATVIAFSLIFLGWTGLFTVNDVHNMTDEILKMKHFDHPNVMTLIGVCVSIGGGPAIVMPYMENGSLLSYLRKDKDNIIMNDDQDLDTVSHTPSYCYCH